MKQIWALFELLLCLAGTTKPATLGGQVQMAMPTFQQIFNKNNLQDLDKFGGLALFARDFVKNTWPNIKHHNYLKKYPIQANKSGSVEIYAGAPQALMPKLSRIANKITEMCRLPEVKLNPAYIKLYYEPERACSNAAANQDTISLAPTFFNLPENQQNGILGHELMHIKFGDAKASAWIKFYTMPPIITVCCGYTAAYLLQKFYHTASENTQALVNSPKKVLSTLLTSHLLHYYTSNVLRAAYGRSYEKRADLMAAKLTNTGNGLYQYFNQRAEEEQAVLTQEQELYQHRKQIRAEMLALLRSKRISHPKFTALSLQSLYQDWAYAAKKTHYNLMRTHPSDIIRANYLKRALAK